MDITLLSAEYTVRRLDENDVGPIYELSRRNELFYRYHPPFVTRESILDDLRAVPPQKTLDDKYYVGFFEGETLVAIMDLILAYPDEHTALIGLFMMNADYQGRGIASHIIADVCRYLRQMGFQKVRIGVDKGNPQSFAFWSKNGFQVVGEKNYIHMERNL